MPTRKQNAFKSADHRANTDRYTAPTAYEQAAGGSGGDLLF